MTSIVLKKRVTNEQKSSPHGEFNFIFHSSKSTLVTQLFVYNLTIKNIFKKAMNDSEKIRRALALLHIQPTKFQSIHEQGNIENVRFFKIPM